MNEQRFLRMRGVSLGESSLPQQTKTPQTKEPASRGWIVEQSGGISARAGWRKNGYGHTMVNAPLPVPNSEAKHHEAWLVLRWVTTRESHVLYPFFASHRLVEFDGVSADHRISRAGCCGIGLLVHGPLQPHLGHAALADTEQLLQAKAMLGKA